MRIDLKKFEGHAPGPWKWAAPETDPGWSDNGPWLTADDGNTILSSWGHDAWGLSISDWTTPQGYPEPAPSSPNAELIAAAPSLLGEVEKLRASLRWALKHVDKHGTATYEANKHEAEELLGKRGETMAKKDDNLIRCDDDAGATCPCGYGFSFKVWLLRSWECQRCGRIFTVQPDIEGVTHAG